ncbi:MAG TPA: D-glycero-beta-D-manno-heptose-7-phosphate kinase [Alphaproteobacteria bacterium]|nr:D-glycero-beta-D-manno-heptose-7-phosphate kinase [Alphaproteobacteria bacterium]
MTERSDLAALVESFTRARVLCVGDVMLDRYIYGEVERISPEAPIPVFRIERETAMVGGAGNVARNIAALGAWTRLVGVAGDDAAGAELRTLLAAEPGIAPAILIEESRPTTIKTRYVAARQQMLRADRESNLPISDRVRSAMVNIVRQELPDCGVMVLSDYGKGVLSAEALRGVIATARGYARPVVVDPKGPDFTRYRGASVITPNRRELAAATNMPVDTDAAIVAAARRVADTCGIENVLVTRSESGVTLVLGRGEAFHIPARPRAVFDVSGAGDTVAATMAVACAAGIAWPEAARLANAAGGIVVGKPGTAVARGDELVAALHTQDLMTGEDKIATLPIALDRIAAWRESGLKIGFTNGCFDLIHPGHVSLLAQARGACDRLVVGLNSDASVRRLKGEGRPVQSEAARAQVLASLGAVDLVVIFAEETPVRLIEAIHPDVLVKGADYRRDQVVGGEIVESYGGRILLAEIVPGHSTTATLAKLAR